MAARTEGLTMDRLTNTGGKAERGTGQQDSSRTLPHALSALVQTVWRSGPARFIRHFLEMVVAMMAGMLPLGLIYVTLSPAIPILEDLAVATALMSIFMTVPMVAWMRHRCHTWRQTAEMSAAMLAPSVPLMALDMWGPAHVAMILGMLGLMLYRRDEYLYGRCHDLSKMGGERG
jgi:flagellar biosynthetic protein FliP